MTAATIRAACYIINDCQVVQANVVNLTEIGSEGSVLRILPNPDLQKNMTLFELHKASTKFYIARNGDIRTPEGKTYVEWKNEHR